MTSDSERNTVTTSDSDSTGTIRLLDDLHSGEWKVCTRCLEPVLREAYFAGDFYCAECVEHAYDFPLKTTHGGTAP